VLIVRGQAHILDAGDLDRARRLLEELEEKESLARLLDGAREADALKIFIGAETKLFSLSGSSPILKDVTFSNPDAIFIQLYA
jgi:heat-inducible transcriptional repressor